MLHIWQDLSYESKLAILGWINESRETPLFEQFDPKLNAKIKKNVEKLQVSWNSSVIWYYLSLRHHLTEYAKEICGMLYILE